MELVYIFRILYRKRVIIIACVLVAVLTAFFFTMKKEKMFKSIAQVSTGYTVSEDIKLSDEIFNLSQIDVKFNNAIENITSPKVISLLSYKLILHDLTDKPFRKLDEKSTYGNFNKEEAIKLFTNKYDSIVILNTGNPLERKYLNLLDEYKYDISSIKKTLFVGRHLRTDYIDIVFRSENPELSAFVVNTLTTEFQRYYESFRRGKSIESMLSLDSLVKKRKLELDQKIAARQQFMNDSVSNVLDPNIVGASQLGQINQYESYLADEQAKSQNLLYQINQIDKQLKEQPVPEKQTENNSEYIALRRQYNALMDDYVKQGSSDPEMRKRLDDLQAKMKEKAPSSTNNSNEGGLTSNQRANLVQLKIDAEGNLRSVNAKIAFYSNKLNELRASLNQISPNSSASLDRFDRDIEIASLEYSSAKEKFNMASDMNEGSANIFKQTMFGQPPLEPEPSKRILTMGLSGLSAFILSSLLFIFLAFLDQSIKTPSQFNRHTGLELLGVTNFINLKATNLKDQVVQIESDDAQRNNSFREMLRKLRFEIEKSGKRVFLFTSTEPQQGKTTLSQALAFSLSVGKKNVLLIDTNFCNNDLTVNNSASPSLESFVGNGQLNSTQLDEILTKTGVPNVDIIGCKGGDYTPSEILPKNHLLKYLPDLLNRYDYVFMEAAPLNGYTDMKELVQYADGVIAIFSASAEIKQTDKESIKYLQSLGDKFMGAILNKVEKSDISL